MASEAQVRFLPGAPIFWAHIRPNTAYDAKMRSSLSWYWMKAGKTNQQLAANSLNYFVVI
jgi:hypothetical protein